jgi:hypothetical protein
MKLLTLALGVVVLSAFTGLSVAYSQPLCPGLSGEARTNCLHAEVERGKRESEAANRKAARLDKAMKVACGADKAGPVAAGTAAQGGGLAYKAGRAVGDKVTGQKPCK